MKGSILFNKDINIEVDVDPAAEEGARLISAKNLVDGQEAGGGGGAFSTATLTVNNDLMVNSRCPSLREEPIPYIETQFNASGTYIVPLYEGNCVLQFEEETSVTYEGNIEELVPGLAYKITGDAEVTITPL